MLNLAARLAARGAGDVEPNPLVGAVIARGDRILGMGHHRRFGGPHAEVEAIADCRARGHNPRGATMYVTLEPCARAGKQPPCTGAILGAGISRVVIARADPHPKGAGGAEVLRERGVAVEFNAGSRLAVDLASPFVKRTTSGLPWVIAKWAQTIDGRVATRTGESKWISGALARARVHRLRARVDAIMVGMGTVRSDDPLLTARDVGRVRRVAVRVIADPRLEMPLTSALVRTAREAPVIAVFDESAGGQVRARAAALEERGVRTVALPADARGISIPALLRFLSWQMGATNVLCEGGPRMLGSLFEAEAVDEAVVYLAPMILGDEHARGGAEGRDAPSLTLARRFALARTKRLGDDVELTYRREGAGHAPVLRPAAPADAPALAQLLYDAFDEFRDLYTPAGFAATVPHPEQIRERMGEGPVWVALDAGVIVGTVSVRPAPEGLYIRGLAVHPAARARGLAGLLMSRVEEYATAERFGRLFLSTTPFLASAIRLYERLGFRRVADGPHDLMGTPLVTMEKVIG
jgi:diaminohydroxyphosphoribosylaminopyrimidine deaminase / 5-amino-6-(5-phosphoribosylamino)uracil reductase